LEQEVGHEEALQRRADHRVFARGRERHQGQGPVPTAQVLGGEILRLAQQVRWHGRLGRQASEGTRGGEREAQEAAGRVDARERGDERGAAKKGGADHLISGKRTSSPGSVGQDAEQRLVGARGAQGRPDDRECIALSTGTGSQHRA
jgi:hypothetical protein